MLSQKKPLAEHLIQPLASALKPVNPNLLTIIGSIPPLLFFVFLTQGNLTLAAMVMPLFSIDLLDGAVARLNNKTTPFGEFLDSTIDRISDFLIITAFGFANLVRFEIIITFLFAAYMVSYTRSRGELAANKKTPFNIGLMERTERLIGIFISLIIFILAPSLKFLGMNILEIIFILLTMLSIITFLQRILHAYKNL